MSGRPRGSARLPEVASEQIRVEEAFGESGVIGHELSGFLQHCWRFGMASALEEAVCRTLEVRDGALVVPGLLTRPSSRQTRVDVVRIELRNLDQDFGRPFVIAAAATARVGARQRG